MDVSVIVVLTDDQLHDQRNVLDLSISHESFGAFVVIVFLFDEVVDAVELVADLLLEVGAQGLDLAAYSVFVSDPWDFL
jgi:hypothetical protein